MLSSILEDLSYQHMFGVVSWKQSRETAGSTRIHSYVWEPGELASKVETYTTRQWTQLNLLHTGVGGIKL